ncbi:MAG TPA: signal peptidase II [Thermoleophilaceae bacterium]|nr:signal peptidase II [Thermoleophilaceae bacterium]
MSAAAAGWRRAGATVTFVLAMDQATKALITSSLERGESVRVFYGLELTNTRNTGVAFGALEGSGTIVGALIAVVLVFLIAYFALHAARRWLWLPVGMLLGGATGNLVDRVREGAVIDFIDPVAWPAFNVADMAIVGGVAALLYLLEATPSER